MLSEAAPRMFTAEGADRRTRRCGRPARESEEGALERIRTMSRTARRRSTADEGRASGASGSEFSEFGSGGGWASISGGSSAAGVGSEKERNAEATPAVLDDARRRSCIRGCMAQYR